MTTFNRRDFVKSAGAIAAWCIGNHRLRQCWRQCKAEGRYRWWWLRWRHSGQQYIAMWSEGKIDVTLVERGDTFVSCPLSNLVIGGSETDWRHLGVL